VSNAKSQATTTFRAQKKRHLGQHICIFRFNERCSSHGNLPVLRG
jgi:hypothetical protein